jgi:hypothetical protein
MAFGPPELKTRLDPGTDRDFTGLFKIFEVRTEVVIETLSGGCY